jgi:hypothetical protein|tara:strand:- start:1145 stop:2059 length:915 start_codon:yes stop_codon:yes gene_type:complete
MSLLTSHTQVHPGLLVAIVELLAVAERPIGEPEQLERLLQPRTLQEILGRSPPSGSLNFAVDASEWLGLAKRTDEGLVLSDSLAQLESRELARRLPTVMAKGFFERTWSQGISEHRGEGGDVALALAWLLAQDLWNAGLDDDTLELRYAEQIQEQEEDGNGLINPTKLRTLRRWASYLGLGRRDPVNDRLLVPDPTRAVRSAVTELSESEYSASGFVSEIAKICPVLDGGKVRKVIVKSMREGVLEWESRREQVSPSLSLALYRLNAANLIEYGLRDDVSPAQRRELRLKNSSQRIGHVRILGR